MSQHPENILSQKDIPLRINSDLQQYFVMPCSTGGYSVYREDGAGGEFFVEHCHSDQKAIRKAIRLQKKENAR